MLAETRPRPAPTLVSSRPPVCRSAPTLPEALGGKDEWEAGDGVPTASRQNGRPIGNAAITPSSAETSAGGGLAVLLCVTEGDAAWPKEQSAGLGPLAQTRGPARENPHVDLFRLPGRRFRPSPGGLRQVPHRSSSVSGASRATRTAAPQAPHGRRSYCCCGIFGGRTVESGGSAWGVSRLRQSLSICRVTTRACARRPCRVRTRRSVRRLAMSSIFSSSDGACRATRS